MVHNRSVKINDMSHFRLTSGDTTTAKFTQKKIIAPNGSPRKFDVTSESENGNNQKTQLLNIV